MLVWLKVCFRGLGMRGLSRLKELSRYLLGGVALTMFAESLRFLYLWGRDIDTVWHFGWAILIGLAIGGAFNGSVRILARYPVLSAKLRRLSPWSKLAPKFKKTTKFGIRPFYVFVALCYVLFYLTEGLTGERAWADWINRKVFHLVFLGQEYSAEDILPFYILGFAMLVVAESLFRTRCPLMLARSTQASSPNKDPVVTSYEFAETIETASSEIPTRDLYKTLNHLAERNRLVIEQKAVDPGRIRALLLAMSAAVEGDKRLLMIGHAADFARHLPEDLGRDMYVTGRALFDAVRWRARFAIFCFSILSAALVGLLMLYHVVWVFLPNIERVHS
jgi:hypothetical protein